ncbi:MAG: hypothetical protein HYY84_10725 [Deltaproteobacteria bacterium]|nr:hypothetical protein [Deltaproteobacteria bacterium]
MKKYGLVLATVVFAVPVVANAQFGGFKKPVVAAPSKDEVEVKGLWKPIKSKIDDLIEKLKAVTEEKAKELAAKITGRLQAHVVKVDAEIEKKRWPSSKKLIEAGATLAADALKDAAEILKAALGDAEALKIKGLWTAVKKIVDEVMEKLKAIPGDLAKEPIGKIDAHNLKIDGAIGEKKWPEAEKLIGDAKNLVAEISKDLKGLAEKAKDMAADLVKKALVEVVQKQIDALKDKALGFKARVMALYEQKVDKKVKKWLDEADELYKDAMEYAAKGKEKAKKVLKEVMEKFQEIEERLREKAVDLLKKVADNAKERLAEFEKKVDEVKNAVDAKAKELRDQAYQKLAEAQKIADDKAAEWKKTANEKLAEAEDLVKKAVDRAKAAVEEAKAAVAKLRDEVTQKVLAEKQKIEKFSERMQNVADEKAKAAWAEFTALKKKAEDLAAEGKKEAEEVAGKVAEKAKEVEQLARDYGKKAMEFVKDRYEAVQKKAEEIRGAADEKAKEMLTAADDLVRQAEDVAAKSKEEAEGIFKKAEGLVAQAAERVKKAADAAKGVVEAAFTSAKDAVAKLKGALAGQVEGLVAKSKDKTLKKLAKEWGKQTKKGDEASSWMAIDTLRQIVDAAVKANVLLSDSFKTEWGAIIDAAKKETQARLAKAKEQLAWLDGVIANKDTNKKAVKAARDARKVLAGFHAKVELGNAKGWLDFAKAEKLLQKLKDLKVAP